MAGASPALAAHMRDVVYVAITGGFFAVAAGFVRGCARIVGPDDPSLDRDEHAAVTDEPAAAGTGSVRS